MNCEDKCQTVKPIYKRSSSYPTEANKMTEPRIDKRDLTHANANALDGFLLIRTNFEGDLILDYYSIEVPKVVNNPIEEPKCIRC